MYNIIGNNFHKYFQKIFRKTIRKIMSVITELKNKMMKMVDDGQITQEKYDSVMKKEFRTRREFKTLLEKANRIIQNV